MLNFNIIVMGVSGSGKSTIAEALAKELQMTFIDGDNLHPQANIDKMSAGHPLNDEDRKPWLTTIHETAKQHALKNEHVVIVCSALKKSYRDVIRGEQSLDQPSSMRFVFLSGSYELILARMQAREGHFMKADMLKSQFNILEQPSKSENDVICIDIDAPIEKILTQSLVKLKNNNSKV